MQIEKCKLKKCKLQQIVKKSETKAKDHRRLSKSGRLLIQVGIVANQRTKQRQSTTFHHHPINPPNSTEKSINQTNN